MRLKLLKNYYCFLFIVSTLLISCSENFHLTGSGTQNGSLSNGNLANLPTVNSTAQYKSNSDGNWESPLSMKDPQGSSISEGLINYQLKDCETNTVYFNGDFNYSSDLTTSSPLEIFINLMDWEDDIQPYFLAPSILGDGSSLIFDKKAWAIANNLNYHATENLNGTPVKLCQSIGIKNAEGQVVASSTVTYDLLYKHVFDNNTYSNEIVNSFPFFANQFATTGGIEYIQNGNILSSLTPSICNNTNLNLYYLVGNNTEFRYVTAIKHKESLGYQQVTFTGENVNDAISMAFNTEFIHFPRPDYGTNCTDYYNSVSQESDYSRTKLLGVQVQNNLASPTEIVRFKINILEIF